MRTRRPDASDPCGWRVSLDFRGYRLSERGYGGGEIVRVGEGSGANLVLPGIGGEGGEATLLDGDWLFCVDGIEGEVTLAGVRHRLADFTSGGAVRLEAGDSAELHLRAHPEVALTLVHEPLPRVGWGLRLGLRDLAQSLALGGVMAALVALLVQVERPVTEVKLAGEPEGSESAFRRVLFASLVDLPQRTAPRALPAIPTEIRPPAALGDPRPSAALGVGKVAEPAAAPVAEGGELALVGGIAEDEVADPGNDALLEAVPELGERDEIAQILTADDHAAGLLGVLGGGGEVAELFADGEPEELVAIGRVLDAPVVTGSAAVDDDDEPPRFGVLGGVESGVVGGVVGGVVVPGDYAPLPSVLEEPGDQPEPRSGGRDSHNAEGGLVLRGEGGTAAVVPEVVCDDPDRRPKEQVDVVFVVDVSTTMGFMVDRVEQGIGEVDAAIRGLARDPRYGLVVFVDDVLVANGGQAFTEITDLQAELTRWRHFTSSNRQIQSPESNLDWPENSLDALHAAATRFDWRPASSTLRLVVHATDDDFGEAPAIQSGQRVEHTYRETVEALRDREIRVATFGASLGGQCECLDVKPGLRAPYFGQPSIPDATGGAAFDIDAVAKGDLSFASAVKSTLGSTICRAYPLLPF